jgi:hypothetical protein
MLGQAEVTYLTTPVTNPLAGLVPANSNANGATIQPQYLLLPFPEFQSVTEAYSPIGSAPYNALQITVTKQPTHGFTIAGNMTWQKIMDHTGFLDNYEAANGTLEHVWDNSGSFFGNIYGTYELPKFATLPFYEREILGGWKLNGACGFPTAYCSAYQTAPSTSSAITSSRTGRSCVSTTPASRTPRASCKTPIL